MTGGPLMAEGNCNKWMSTKVEFSASSIVPRPAADTVDTADTADNADTADTADLKFAHHRGESHGSLERGLIHLRTSCSNFTLIFVDLSDTELSKYKAKQVATMKAKKNAF